MTLHPLTISYEYPLNELIRVCLRVEYLIRQVEYYSDKENYFDSRMAMTNLVELISLVDRPDLRTKLTTELLRYRETIQKLESKVAIHREKLVERLECLNQDIAYLQDTYGKFGHLLRENEFLNTVRFALSRPGGAWSFDMPLYEHWLQEPCSVRQQDLTEWLKEFSGLKTIIQNMLKLLRDWSLPEARQAENGFFQIILDPKLTYQLIQLNLSKGDRVIPEISSGKHRLTIRFLEIDYQKRPQQTARTIAFDMKMIVSSL